MVHKAKFRENIIPGKKCIFCISVGQKYHENNKLDASIDIINKTFSFCYILLADTLQRHTISYSEPQISEHIALKKGDEWLERNNEIIKKFIISYQIIRWDFFRSHKNFDFYESKIKESYLYKNLFNNIVNDTCFNFYKIYTKHNKFIEYEKFKQTSINYILEECAVINLFTELNSEYMIYPNKLPLSLQMILEEIQIDNPNLLHFAQIFL